KNVFSNNGHGADTDPEGQTIAVAAFEGSAANVGKSVDLEGGGRARLNADGQFWFNPDGDFDDLAPGTSATTSFTYMISDGHGGVDEAVASFTISAPNSPPVARDDDVTGTPTGTVSRNVFADNGHGADSDPDGQSFTVTAVEGVAANVGQSFDLEGGGRLRLTADGQFWFNPDGDFGHVTPEAPDGSSFTYQITDSAGASSTATVRVTVAIPNRAPDAVDDVIAGRAHGIRSGNLLTNDRDPDGNPLTVTALDGVAGAVGQRTELFGDDGSIGFLRVNANGAWWYDPAGQMDWLDFETGPQRFEYDGPSYTVGDGLGGFDTADILIQFDI
ncbi:MAG: Ig-like domain-containing protein, partial [Pseudomonadota bacterium]|nr:Ig-like domain-containing protein [Pseudomonadota bacterium]